MFFSKRTSRRSTNSRERMLELRVTSPRILFCDALKVCVRLVKYAGIASLVVALGIAGKVGYQKFFIESHEFVLQKVPVTTFAGTQPLFFGPARVLEATGIDGSASIFSFDIDEAETRLAQLPELIEARLTRRLPGELKVEVIERIPVAWVACPALGIQERDHKSGFLIDATGVPFSCSTQALAEYARNLPVVFAAELPDGGLVAGQEINDEGLSRALALVHKADMTLAGDELPDWVKIKDEIHLEMMTVGGTKALCSYFDHDAQLARLQKLAAHARDRGQKLETINLIPRRYVPVTYHTDQ